MYLNATGGYDRHGEQFARGRFLILFSHNEFKWAEENGKHWNEFPTEKKRKLYACVRWVSLHQFGHWMMGTARIGGYSLTLSGAYGSDGLPCDYETLPAKARMLLTEVPAELTEIYWKGGGHNSAGNEASAMKEWAQRAFKNV